MKFRSSFACFVVASHRRIAWRAKRTPAWEASVDGVLFSFVWVIMSFKLRKVKFEPKVKPNHNIFPEKSDIPDIYLHKVPDIHFPLASRERVVLVSLPNRTVERRGRQNAWFWQTWQGYYLRVLSGILLTLMFCALLRKDLFLGMSRLSHKVCRRLSSPVLA